MQRESRDDPQRQSQQGQLQQPSRSFVRGIGASGQAAEIGSIQGTVRSVDFGNGLLRVAGGNRTLTVHARPDELAEFRPGDQVSLDYSDYAGMLWIASGGSGVSAQEFAESGTVSGIVTGLDKSRGRVTLQGPARAETFLGHPEDLQSLIPGQYVSITFERVQNNDWVQSINQGGR